MFHEQAHRGATALLRPTWFEIDLDAIAHNLRQLRRMVGPRVAIYACLKRNAYGCGAIPVAQVMQREGADAIAVGNINDALAIRESRVSLPILLYPNCLASEAGPAVMRHRLMPTISGLDEAAAWEQEADGGTLDVFAKIDVGLFRGGAMPREALTLLRRIADSNVLRLAGAYAHLHGYDPATGDDYAQWQFRKFQTVMGEAASRGIDVPVRMVASTSVVLQHPEMDLNGVDPGGILFGLKPSPVPSRDHPMRPAVRAFKSRLILTKWIEPDDAGGFTGPFAVGERRRIGVLPLGWGDGVPRHIPGPAVALMGGRRVPVVGPVHLEHMRVDLTGVPDAKVGDEVVFLGTQGDETITIEQLTECWGIDGLDFLGGMRDHIQRTYFRNGAEITPGNAYTGECGSMVFGSSARQFKVLDIERISERLFEQEQIREKLCRDFCIEDVGDPVKMANGLVNSMGQITPRDGGTEDLEDNRTVVFRAAALALASNMRQWSRVLSCRGKFEALLEQYGPVTFSREIEADCARVQDIEDCLGGRTARADAEAIVKWATMLAKYPGYFNALNKLKSDMEARIHDGEVVPVLAALLGSLPTKRMEKRWPPPSGMESWKAPGMGMPLASEFLRNLHWKGFKPDRHIKRLIGRWFPEVVEAKSGRASYLAREILYCGSEDVIVGLKFSLAGMAVTPNDCSFTKADNLVWALGAYVEKKDRESEEVYWKTIAASECAGKA